MNLKTNKKELNKTIMGDSCTGVPDFNFTECCAEHDKDYEEATLTRYQADKKLRLCISKKRVGFYNYRLMPWIYFAGVRVFGGSHYGKGGGSGCKICRFFKEKTAFLNKFFL